MNPQKLKINLEEKGANKYNTINEQVRDFA